MIEVIPSILTNDPQELAELMQSAEGKAKRVQVDIVDGKFANNKTIDPAIVTNETSLLLDFHLLVDEPINWVEKCARAGADRIIGQIEMMRSQEDFIRKVQSENLEVGLGVDLQTDLSAVNHDFLLDLNVILLMSVKAGFGGQKFEEEAFEKVHDLTRIEKLVEMKTQSSHSFKICLDGGVTSSLFPKLEKMGVDEVVIGRRWFSDKY
jgi:ribulose-phosphate 3-epimerase